MDPNPDVLIEAPQGHALSLRSVTKAFGGLVAVDGIDLDVVHGQRLGLLGPNGAGKTTLFNLVAGDMRPTSGTIEIGGVDCTMLASRHRAAMGVARTYQRTRLFGGLTVTDNLYLAQTGKSGRHRALWKSEEDELLREKAAGAAAKVWLGKRKDDTVDDLSHGERRQLEVAMALVTEPSILLLDEPASGLSQGERENLTQLLLGLPRELTLVLIEHDMDVALRAAERIVVMSDGKMVASGSTEEIRHDPIVHEIYLGEPGEE
ncbi:MAG TPA: ABC transporter ATP-binding protein [Acidimicrobiia bacterium]|nr:ABC transporter ATP-binding protein [Acidimicrobiia bacterium]